MAGSSPDGVVPEEIAPLSRAHDAILKLFRENGHPDVTIRSANELSVAVIMNGDREMVIDMAKKMLTELNYALIHVWRKDADSPSAHLQFAKVKFSGVPYEIIFL